MEDHSERALLEISNQLFEFTWATFKSKGVKYKRQYEPILTISKDPKQTSKNSFYIERGHYCEEGKYCSVFKFKTPQSYYMAVTAKHNPENSRNVAFITNYDYDTIRSVGIDKGGLTFTAYGVKC